MDIKRTIQENIEYEFIREKYTLDRLDEIVELMTDTVCSSKATIKINGADCPIDAVRDRYLRIGPIHIEYIFECLSRNTTKVRNIRSYLLTTIYNSIDTKGLYYQAEVNHDLYGDSN